jgi:hypothetical protein
MSLRGAVGSLCGNSFYDIQVYDYGLKLHFVGSLLWEWRGLEFYEMIPFFFRIHELTRPFKVSVIRACSVLQRRTIHVSIAVCICCVFPDYPSVHGRNAANEDLRVGPSELFVARRLNSNTTTSHNAQSRAVTSASALGSCASCTVVKSLQSSPSHIRDRVWRRSVRHYAP